MHKRRSYLWAHVPFRAIAITDAYTALNKSANVGCASSWNVSPWWSRGDDYMLICWSRWPFLPFRNIDDIDEAVACCCGGISRFEMKSMLMFNRVAYGNFPAFLPYKELIGLSRETEKLAATRSSARLDLNHRSRWGIAEKLRYMIRSWRPSIGADTCYLRLWGANMM